MMTPAGMSESFSPVSHRTRYGTWMPPVDKDYGTAKETYTRIRIRP